MRPLLDAVRLGGWAFYLDPNRMFLGRSAERESVVYAAFGVVAEHLRPDGHSARAAAARRLRTIRRWQKTRNRLWQRALLVLPYIEGETADQLDARRLDYVQRYYDAAAADARAMHPERWVPALQEVAVAPMPADYVKIN